MDNRLKGVIAALITPYTDNGDVNYHELKKLVRHLINQNIDGFYVGGSTAEVFLLTEDERKKILEAVVEENNGEKCVISHVGHVSTDRAVDLALHAKSTGADIISAISPFYYKFSTEEIKRHYFNLMDRSGMPFIIYHFPSLSNLDLTNDMISEFSKNELLTGVKFTSKDLYKLERIKSMNKELAVLNGYDEMLCYGLAAGADGGIGSTYNCLCPLIRKIYDNHKEGNLDISHFYQQQVNHIIDLMIKNGVFASVKAILETQGIKSNGCREPFSPISESGREELVKVYNRYMRALE